MDAFELLKKDHKKVSQLFKEIEAASGQTKKQIFSRLKSELDVHAQVEERIFYPALENKEEARDITLEAYEEHKVVKDLLGELASGNAPEDEWDAKLTVLKENVEHHVEEEEGELFSKARQALSRQEIEQLGVEMEAEKASQPGNAAPAKSSTRAGSEAGSKARNKARNKVGRTATKESNGSESPGVLKRLANLVGLGGGSKSRKSPAKRRRPSTPAKAAKSAAGKKAAKKTNAAKGASQTQSSKTSKKATKKSATKSTKGSRSRGATKKSAARGGPKKAQGRTAKKRNRSR
ncbi:MAG: hemerythrin domain-containing protein [Blastocatellia bacterium]|nr:hemerythrin domain-containing protein [Blastocatellia bacterium]